MSNACPIRFVSAMSVVPVDCDGIPDRSEVNPPAFRSSPFRI